MRPLLRQREQPFDGEQLMELMLCDLCIAAYIEKHNLTHRNADYECLGCYKRFKTYGGMIIHLEYGNCASDIDRYDLNQSAASCPSWKKFIDSHDRRELRHRQHPSGKPFFCPTCGKCFDKLSSLFQHVESPCCAQKLGTGAIGNLVAWLRHRHG